MENIITTVQRKISSISLEAKLLFVWLCEIFVLTVVRFLLAKVGISSGIAREILLWAVASMPLLFFFGCIGKIEIKSYAPFFVLFFFVIVSMVLSVLFNQDLLFFYTRPSFGIERILRPDCALFAFLFFVMVKDSSDLRKVLVVFTYFYFLYISVIDLVPALLRGYWLDIGPDGKEIQFSYSLSFGYSAAFCTIVFLYNFFRQKGILSLFLSLIGLWAVITQGNRGALVVLVVFVGLMIISNIVNSQDITKKTLKILLIVLGLLIIVLFGDKLLDAVISLLNSLGLNSRTLAKLKNASFADDNGRSRIWGTVITAIRNGSIFGYGILGERPFVFPIHVAGYSHNLFLEIIAAYGIFGVLIIGYIIADAIRMIFFCKDREWREIYIILFASSCQLLLSMSFWYVWQFWAAAAIAYRYRNLIKVPVGTGLALGTSK